MNSYERKNSWILGRREMNIMVTPQGNVGSASGSIGSLWPPEAPAAHWLGLSHAALPRPHHE
jgi:hypothetical protein